MREANNNITSLPTTHQKDTTTNRSKVSVKTIFNYFTLIAVLFLSASHESDNPNVGQTTVEFYAQELQESLMIELTQNLSTSDSTAKTSEEYLQYLVASFYNQREYTPAWTINFNVNTQAQEVLDELGYSYFYGLDSMDYQLPGLRELVTNLNNVIGDSIKISNRVELEKNITYSTIKFFIHLGSGINNQDTSSAYANYLEGIPTYLNHYHSTGQIKQGIADIQPSFFQYKNLRKALVRYLNAVHIDSVEVDAEKLELNQELLAEYLINRAYLHKDFKTDSTATIVALKNFQKFHGLKETGKLDKRTKRHIRKSSLYRYKQIALNLDRLRKQSIEDENCIYVNIPEYTLKVIEEGDIVTELNVVVGKVHTPTPELSSRIERVVANPYWTVPKSITFGEILPKVKKDSTYLQRNGYMVISNSEEQIDMNSINWQEANRENFNYWIRQKNSSSNALGLVKFLFPNNHRVYIHDTPSKKYFARDIRAYSHGCVRLQNPDSLANYLVNRYYNSEEDSLNMTTLIRKRMRRNVSLKTSVPVHLRYITCSADEDGNLYFFTDIYSKDEKALRELHGEQDPV